MTTTVWVRDNPTQEWRPAFNDLPKPKAHQVSDRYNEKYDKETGSVRINLGQK